MIAAMHFPAIHKRKRFEDGERLPAERALAERFGLGRPSVREALRTLSQLGLVEIRAGEGAFTHEALSELMLKTRESALKIPGAAPDAFGSHQWIFLAIKARAMAVHLDHVRARLETALAKRRRER